MVPVDTVIVIQLLRFPLLSPMLFVAIRIVIIKLQYLD
jgi:hypothetical protein